jgi:hypothetical protein
VPPVMDESVSQASVWAECERAGELEVRQRVAPNGIWGNANVSQYYGHAQAWLRARDWDRQRALEKYAKRAAQAAWIAALAAVVSVATVLWR